MHALNRSLLTAALILSASACTTQPVAVTPPKAEPLDLACDADQAAQCSGDCPTLPAWTTDVDGAGSFDSLLGLGPRDRMALAACQAKLRACQACINRGRKAGVIR